MSKDVENNGAQPVSGDGGVAAAPADGSLPDRGKQGMSDAEQRRRERAAAKLRENLARRKQQSRARRAGEAEDGVGLPAARAAGEGAPTPGGADEKAE